MDCMGIIIFHWSPVKWVFSPEKLGFSDSLFLAAGFPWIHSHKVGRPKHSGSRFIIYNKLPRVIWGDQIRSLPGTVRTCFGAFWSHEKWDGIFFVQALEPQNPQNSPGSGVYFSRGFGGPFSLEQCASWNLVTYHVFRGDDCTTQWYIRV